MEIRHIAARDGRLSSFLRQELGLSAGLMNRLKWAQRLYVNGIARHADYPVRAGDVIVAQLDDTPPQYPAQDGPLTVLYEDEHILCVDKPAGMLIHPSRSRNRDTLANYVLGYYQSTGQSCAFHPITRLDRDTFGVVLLAKNAHIHGLFTQMQAENRLKKTYEALVWGVPTPEAGVIDAPIARRPLPSLLRQVDPAGKPSVTRYQLMAALDGYSHLRLQPVTGRTHQLRVHCAHRGFPILGDPQYGDPRAQALSQQLGYTTQALCASGLEFVHPVTGQALQICSRQGVDRRNGA